MAELTEQQIKKVKKLITLRDNPSLAVFDELENINSRLIPIKDSLKGVDFIKGPKGEDGEDGKDGKNGYTPIKNKDYFDGENGRNGIDGKDGKNGKDGLSKDGLDGKDGFNGDKGDKPDHKWDGTKLKFEKPNGKWGREVDLKGETGKAVTIFSGRGGGGRVNHDSTLSGDGSVADPLSAAGMGTGIVDSVVAGTGISVNSTDPANPIITNTNPTPYTLPTSSASVLGGIKVGARLTMTGEVLSADVQTTGFASLTTPTFLTNITTPLIIGGTAVGDYLIYKSTTGAGTTTGIAHQWLGGTNGATVIATMLNNGSVGIGTTNPLELLSLGTAGTKAGVLSLAGLTSGKAIIVVPAVAGTPTLTLPITTGTLALTSDIVSQVEDNITDAHTTIAPSGNAVFDALALKAPLASPTFTGTVTLPAGTTTNAPVKLTAGTLLTTPVLGTLEYVDNGTTGNLYFTLNVGGVATRISLTQFA